MVSFAFVMPETTPDAGRQLAAPKRSDDDCAPDLAPPLRGFWALIVTQFQGAFSDNVVKNLVVFVALFGTGMTRLEKNSYGEWIGALFALPFILFSMTGGFLADRFSKRSVMLGVKTFELFIMSLVFAGLWSWNKYLLLAGVFLMGTHSAIFGPSKYGSLPELLPEKKLSWGNGILELGTWMAVILGIVAAAAMSGQFRGRQWLSGVILIALAVVGFISCLGITKIPAADPRRKFNANFPAEIWRQVRAMRGDRPLWLALAGNTYFSFLGMLLLLNLFFYGSETLGVTEQQIGCLSAALALGIGFGSVAAGYLSGGKIEYGLVPLGALGLSIFSAWLAQPAVTFGRSFVLLALLGFSGGFFIVPDHRAVAASARPRKQGAGAGHGQLVVVRRRVPRVWRALAARAKTLAVAAPDFSRGRRADVARRNLCLAAAARRAAALCALAASRGRFTGSVLMGATTFPKKAARSSFATTFPGWTRCC